MNEKFGGVDYAYLIDTKDLDNYYQQLLIFHQSNPQSAQTDFETYITTSYIDATKINQVNNRTKRYYRNLCKTYMIWAFVLLFTMLLPFGINFGREKSKNKSQNISIDSTINVNLYSRNNILLLDSLLNNRNKMAKEREGHGQTPQKPSPPPIQMIRDGVDPKKQYNHGRNSFGDSSKGQNK